MLHSGYKSTSGKTEQRINMKITTDNYKQIDNNEYIQAYTLLCLNAGDNLEISNQYVGQILINTDSGIVQRVV